MNDRITGFILNQRDYKESALILTVLTEEYGKISLIAAGAKKMSSKNAGSILPYTKAEFMLDYRDDRTMFRMKTAAVLAFYRIMHEDLKASLAAAVLAESADALMYDGVDIEVGRKIYHMLDQGFALLNQRKRADIIMAVFLADLLRNTGIGPNVDECAICGEKKISAISVRDGGFLCADCAGKQGMLLNSVTRLKQFRLICKADMDKYDIVESCVSDCREDVGLLLAILKEHGNIEIRSFGLYNRLFCH